MRTPPFLALFTVLAVNLATVPRPLVCQEQKTAGDAFKNIQVLKRVPADQWFDTMAFISGSLGVTCDHCHSAQFETDEGNPNKLKAREMMRMVDAINTERFAGKVVVTCYTCHRGDTKPQGTPIPDSEHWIQASESVVKPLEAEVILNRYRNSISSIRTQSLSLRVETFGGKGPARLKSAEMLLDGVKAEIVEREGKKSRTMIRNGKKAWIDEGTGWREMSLGETFDAFEVANVFSPDQVGAVVPSGSVFIDRSLGSSAYVVPVRGKDGRKWLFFDLLTGLLVKQRQLFSSFYGDGSVDVNYKGYRKFGKVFLPTTIEVVNAGGAGLIMRHVISRRVNMQLPQSAFQPQT